MSSASPHTMASLAQAMEKLWETGLEPEIYDFLDPSDSLTAEQLAELVRFDQRRRFAAGKPTISESYFANLAVLQASLEIATDIAYHEFLLREEFGYPTNVDEFVARFPELQEQLLQQIRFHQAMLETACDEQDGRIDPSNSHDNGLANFQDLPGYEVREVIACGGMSVVFRARHIALNRWVAIKVLVSDVLTSMESIQRFLREAATIAKLKHPNIVEVFDVGEHRGRPFLVLELVHGGSLVDHYRGHSLPQTDVLPFVIKIVQAVQHCHALGIIHRDLKPGNILLEPLLSLDAASHSPMQVEPLSCWNPRVSDFGLSKVLDDQAMEQPTRTGSILGTPAYMSPEQARAEVTQIGPASDIYSIGTILYELLTGRPPFQGTTPIQVIQQIVHEEAIAPSRLKKGLPKPVELICLKCMAKSPTQRYANCAELLSDLQNCIAGKPIQARPAGIIQSSWRWSRHHPRVSAFVGAASLLILLASIAWTMHLRILQRSRTDALVASLLTLDSAQVMPTIANLKHDSQTAIRSLEEARKSLELSGRTNFNVELATCNLTTTISKTLLDFVPTSQPQQLLLISRLDAHIDSDATQGLWDIAMNPNVPASGRLRAACLLSANSSTRLAENWQQISEDIAEQVVRESMEDIEPWSVLLSPIAELISPRLSAIVLDTKQFASERIFAATLLGRLVSADPRFLANLLLDADIDVYPVLMQSLESQNDQADLVQVLRQVAEDWNTEKIYAPNISLARRRALWAITMVHLDVHKPLLELLETRDDPTARSYAIELMASARIPVEWIVHSIGSAASPAQLSACLLALGQYDARIIGREEAVDTICQVVAASSDAGVLGAGDWLGRKLNLMRIIEATTRSASFAKNDSAVWQNSFGQTFVVIPPTVMQLGSPESEEEHEIDEQLRFARLDYSFSIACTETTVGQIRKYRDDFSINDRYSPLPQSPANNVSFFQAAAYCRWLSEIEGLDESQMCFPPIEKIGHGMRLPDDYLQRTGYRLPTESEWEIACRAGSAVSWSFGIESRLIGNYGNCLPESNNRTSIVGAFKPNAFGLFDMHGNVAEWCVNTYDVQSKLRELTPGALTIDSERLRLVRGGTFGDIPLSTRSSRLNALAPETEYATLGLRLVRTVTQ